MTEGMQMNVINQVSLAKFILIYSLTFSFSESPKDKDQKRRSKIHLTSTTSFSVKLKWDTSVIVGDSHSKRVQDSTYSLMLYSNPTSSPNTMQSTSSSFCNVIQSMIRLQQNALMFWFF